MPRDRTQDLQQSSRHHDQRPAHGSYPMSQVNSPAHSSYDMSGGSRQSHGHSRQSSSGRPDFSSAADSIHRIISKAEANIASIEKLHSRALVGVSQEETARTMQQLDRLQEDTSGYMDEARRRLKQLTEETKRIRGPEVASRQAQQSALAQRLMNLAKMYQDVQIASKQKYRQRMEREIRIARPDATGDEIARALDSRTGPVFAQEMLSSRIGEQRRALKEVQSRHHEIQRVEQSIEELAQLFTDMQILLDTQQNVIDAIDRHVENTNVYVEQGSTEISKAIVHRENSRKKLWWILIAVIIILIIVGIVVYYYVNQAKNAAQK